MSLFGIFKPKWKHSDLSIRKAEVNKLTDETILLQIINTDNNHEIRKLAIERLTKESNLFEIIKHNPDDKIIFYALDRLQNGTILSDIVSSSLPLGIRIAALIKFKDHKKEAQTNKNQSQIRRKEKKSNLLENNMAHQFNDRGESKNKEHRVIDRSTDKEDKTIIACKNPFCKKKIRVPSNRGELKVACPICRTVFVFKPNCSERAETMEMEEPILYDYKQFIHGKTCFACCEDLSDLSIKNYGDRYGFDVKNFPSKECLYVECLKGHENSLIELSKKQ